MYICNLKDIIYTYTQVYHFVQAPIIEKKKIVSPREAGIEEGSETLTLEGAWPSRGSALCSPRGMEKRERSRPLGPLDPVRMDLRLL